MKQSYDRMIELYNERNRGETKNSILVPFVAILFIAIGVFFLKDFYAFKENGVETTAILRTERVRTRSDMDKDYYNMYAEYKVNGKTYYEYLSGYSTTGFKVGPISVVNTKEGDEITIYYNPENPSEIRWRQQCF